MLFSFHNISNLSLSNCISRIIEKHVQLFKEITEKEILVMCDDIELLLNQSLIIDNAGSINADDKKRYLLHFISYVYRLCYADHIYYYSSPKMTAKQNIFTKILLPCAVLTIKYNDENRLFLSHIFNLIPDKKMLEYNICFNELVATEKAVFKSLNYNLYLDQRSIFPLLQSIGHRTFITRDIKPVPLTSQEKNFSLL
jgi:hypothetical protein